MYLRPIKVSISTNWSAKLREASKLAGVAYFTAPYDLSIVDDLDQYVCPWKVGSGDINWIELIKKLSKGNKPDCIWSLHY